MKPTISDVARLAGVSKALVSKALNGKPISEEARRRILAAAAALDYRPSRSARTLALGRTHTFAFLVAASKLLPEQESSMFYPLLLGAFRSAEANGYSLMYATKLDTDEELVEHVGHLVASRAVDGFLVSHTSELNPTYLYPIIQAKMPLVFIPQSPLSEYPGVGPDNVTAGMMAAEFLLARGHREIAFIYKSDEHVPHRDRKEGFYRAMLRVGCAVRPQWIQDGAMDIESARHVVKKLIASGELPSAILCASDYLAAGAMQAIYEANLRVPHDISVMGFENLEIALATFPQLTTVHYSKNEIGMKAIELLVNWVERGSPSPGCTVQLEVIERGSVASVGRAIERERR